MAAANDSSDPSHRAMLDSYRRLIDEAPAELRPILETLPFRIGVTYRPDGDWSEYSQNCLLYDMPFVIARELGLRGVDLDGLRLAHHFAGFYGLVCDRIADGQVQCDSDLQLVRNYLRTAWAGAAAQAGLIEAATQIEQAMQQWREGLENDCILEGALASSTYCANVAKKTRWLTLITRHMLMISNLPAPSVERVCRTLEVLLVGLQALDDAADENEDRELRGVSYPQALGIEACALRLVAKQALTAAAEHARAAALFELADKAALHAASIRPSSEREALLAPLGALVFLSDLRVDLWAAKSAHTSGS